MKRILLASVVCLPFTATAQEAELDPGTVVKDCADCPEMVVIPPGEFMMGTPVDAREIQMDRGEGPQVKISIGYKFLMGRTEVTHGQFKQFAGETGYPARGGCRVWDGEFDERDDASWRNPYQPADPQDDHPVGCVSWEDAQAYIDWLSEKSGMQYRLPTEAEWEYAGRAGTDTPRFWGSSANQACEYANTFDISSAEEYGFPWYPAACRDGFADMAPVASFKPNPFGLYDMIGNVWEWSQDCFAATHVGRPTDGSAWEWGNGGCANRTIRGGAWMTAPERNRVAWPGRDPVKRIVGYFGFRVARDVDAVYQPEGGQIRRITVITGDVARAKKFWTEALGYTVTFENENFGGENMRRNLNLNEGSRAHFVMMSPGGDGIMVGLIGVSGQDLIPLDKPRDQAPRAGDHYIVIRVADAEHAYEVAAGMGIEMIREPEELGGSTGVSGREFAMWGPDGTRLLIQELHD